MTGKKGSTHYPLTIKLEGVRLFLEERKTRAEITKLLGLRSKSGSRPGFANIAMKWIPSGTHWTPSQGRREAKTS